MKETKSNQEAGVIWNSPTLAKINEFFASYPLASLLHYDI